MVTELKSGSPEDTLQLASLFAEDLQPGTVVLLDGDLGAGKTHFVKGMAMGLGLAPEDVTSPTFTIVHEYAGGRLPLYHIDAYRLDDPNDAKEFGIGEYLNGDGICVIEWPDNIVHLLPVGCIRVNLDKLGTTSRRITIEE